MKTYVVEITKTDVLDFVTCDVCKKVFKMPKNELDIQEMGSISFVGGYGSIFGDGTKVECDICQYCLSELLGKYLRINNGANM